MRLHLAAHSPALLAMLDGFRARFDARMTALHCPLISVDYVDSLGRRTHAYWRGAQFERWTRNRPAFVAPHVRRRAVFLPEHGGRPPIPEDVP